MIDNGGCNFRYLTKFKIWFIFVPAVVMRRIPPSPAGLEEPPPHDTSWLGCAGPLAAPCTVVEWREPITASTYRDWWSVVSQSVIPRTGTMVEYGETDASSDCGGH